MKQLFTKLSKAPMRFLMLAMFLSFAVDVGATHFRYGTITSQSAQTAVNPNRMVITVRQAWRRSFYGAPNVGSIVNTGSTLFIRNLANTANLFTVNIPLTVTSVDLAQDLFEGSYTLTFDFPSQGNFRVYFEGCCRISTLNNNADRAYVVESVCAVQNPSNSSPVASLPAVVNMPTNAAAATYPVPVVDPNGDALTMIAAPNGSFGSGTVQPPGFSVSGLNLVLNTIGKPINSLWNAVVLITDARGARISLDVLIRIVGPSTPPFFNYPPTPANSTIFTVEPGQLVSFSLSASDNDAGDAVTINAAGVPAGANFSNASGNPGTATFNWTPTAAQLGTFVVNFTANDLAGVTTSTSVSIRVAVAPNFVAPTPPDASTYCVVPGTTVMETYTANTTVPNSSVVLSANTAIPPLMTFSPALPTAASNPASTNMTWATQASSWGSYLFEMKATDFSGYFSTTGATWIVNHAPTISSTPITSVYAGQPYSYTVVAADLDIPQGDEIDIESVILPGFLTIVDNGDQTFTISGTPSIADAGPHNIKVELEDMLNHINGTHCGNVTQTFTLNVIPCNLSLTLTPTNPSCPGASSGAVVASLTGANGNVTYTWSNGESGTSISNLPAGNYTLDVEDAFGCTASESVTLTDDPDVLAPVPNVTSLPTITGACGATATAPTATDNCAGQVVGTTSDPLSYTAEGTYTITWTYNDGNGNTSSQTQTVVVDDVTPPVPNVPSLPTITGACGATATAPTATDNCADQVVGTTSDPLSYTAEGTYTITWTYNDGNGNTSSQTQTVVVDDVTPPAISSLPALSGTCSLTATAPTAMDDCAGTITATTTDATSFGMPGNYTINWLFDDGNGNTISIPQAVSVTGIAIDASASSNTYAVGSTATLSATVSPDISGLNVVFTLDNGNGGTSTYTGTYAGSGVYSATVSGLPVEVYKVTVTANTNCGDPGFAYLSIYDPNGGFVTGGGWIMSPETPSLPYMQQGGKANFGFNAKYKKGSSAVDGNTEFQFHAGDLNFKSSTHTATSLVIAGSQAIYKGTGTINGAGDYGFMVSAVDGQMTGGGGADKFRIKIWDMSTSGTVVYDNQAGAGDNATASTIIGGGSIVIHQPGKKVAEKSAPEPVVSNLEIRMANNPATGATGFRVQVLSPDKTSPLQTRVTDLQGRQVEVFRNLVPGATLEFGQQYGKGMYFLEVQQAGQRKVMKLMKQ